MFAKHPVWENLGNDSCGRLVRGCVFGGNRFEAGLKPGCGRCAEYNRDRCRLLSWQVIISSVFCVEFKLLSACNKCGCSLQGRMCSCTQQAGTFPEHLEFGILTVRIWVYKLVEFGGTSKFTSSM